MKAYGYERRDKLECPYGCCTSSAGKDRNCRHVSDRQARKAGRREGKIECREAKNSEFFEKTS